MRALVALGTALVALACSGGSPRLGPRAAPHSAVGFSRPPVVDGSRRACLEPPYTPGEAAALADGTPVTREDEGRSWVVALAGERELEPEAISAALGALREQPGLRFISYGLHCGGSSRMCLRLSGNLCELRVDEAVAAVRAGIAADPAIAGAQIELSVQLAGNLEPRCAADDPACLPVPYEGGTYDRLGSRLGGVFASHSAGECDYDGQCMRMGCGNHCLSWEYGGANEGATCEGYSFPRPIFCGCVDSECQWFSQR